MVRSRFYTIFTCLCFIVSCAIISFCITKNIHFINNYNNNWFSQRFVSQNLWIIHSFLVGFILLLLSIKNLFAIIRKQQKIKKLYDSGIRVYAKVISIQKNNSNNNIFCRSYIIRCEYFDEAEQKLYHFNSEKFWKTLLLPQVGKKIPVYVQVNDFSKYYVDVKSVMKQHS